MRKRSEWKKSAKHVLKGHYALLVLICVVVSLLGSGVDNSTNFLTTSITPETETGGTVDESGTTTSLSLDSSQVIREALYGNMDESKANAEALKEAAQEKSQDPNASKVLGRTRGVLAGAVNAVTSGSVYITILSAINSVSHSHNIAMMIFIICSCILMVLVWMFFSNILVVLENRVFLESRIYKKIPPSKLLFLVKVKKWTQVAWDMLVMIIFQSLWTLTIVGGVIKSYSYAMVPYILAENPSLKAREAINLSRKLMNGHKWECFVLDVTFVGWNILGVVTLGISNLFFAKPYKTAVYAEYYHDLRQQGIENRIAGFEGLNDTYLYEKASEELLREKYQDVYDLMQEEQVPVEKRKGIMGFIANVFGVVIFNDAMEQAYEKEQVDELKIRSFKSYIDGSSYPSRLFTVPEKEKRKKAETSHYLRHYSVWSLILLFFTFALIGWLWEVSLHLVSDGVFVNRGVLHGPWLPIYGTGGILILVALNKFRKYPLVEFIAAIIVCGCVEYFTAYYLEIAHDGKKWWDYSGYFLNLDGRICAEGLLVFGVGGMAIVYVLAPFLDNFYKKIKLQIIIPLSVALLLIFTVDQIYSKKHPNMGAGITDYASISVQPDAGALTMEQIL
ncbi:MAG: DUF975 family protein [Lachnospiraceae bacterium]|nr:DUF975 family protein [Lachnospiraceae bacterium]